MSGKLLLEKSLLSGAAVLLEQRKKVDRSTVLWFQILEMENGRF